jgi:putative tryptophan/tyrosine transport system substrate-binding protein
VVSLHLRTLAREGPMTVTIGRRELLAALGGAAAWPLTASAQQSERMRRLGVLVGYAESDSDAQAKVAAFQEGFNLGWVEGRNITWRGC